MPISFKLFFRYLLLNTRIYWMYYFLIGLGFLAIFGTIAYLLTFSQPQLIEDFLRGNAWLFINLGGMVMSLSATSIYAKYSNNQMLILPITSVIRFVKLYLWTIPFYLVVILIFYDLLENGIEKILVNLHFIKHFTTNIFETSCKYSNISFAKHLLNFFLLQTTCLMAGSFFPKRGFFKSIGILFLVFILYLLFGALIPVTFTGSQFMEGFVSIMNSSDYHAIYLHQLMPFTVIFWHIIWVLLIPVFSYITYLQVKGLED